MPPAPGNNTQYCGATYPVGQLAFWQYFTNTNPPSPSNPMPDEDEMAYATPSILYRP